MEKEYTFENFVVSDSNRFAYEAARHVCRGEGKAYHPLYIYGESGCGKTHLLKAMEHQIRKEHPEMRVKYVTAQQYTLELIDMIRGINGETRESFHRKYREDVDVLLVDDIQFLSGREVTMEDFSFTFECLDMADKQMVIAGNVPPKQIPKFYDKLLYGCLKGLVIELERVL